MPRLKVRIRVNGNPLRRAYVEHLFFGATAGTYMTDNSGRVRDENGDEGINSVTSTADIRIFCQNSVARVLDGEGANIAVHQDANIGDGSIVNLNTNAEQDDHYAILNRCFLAYDVIFRQFRPYSELAQGNFPLGRQSTLRATKAQGKRIEVSYPSQFPLGDLAFVEPNSVSTGYPLVHIRHRSLDGRLFGEAGQAPTLIPGEFAHALHFSRFSSTRRERVRNDYLAWFIDDLANGGDGKHMMGKRTSPTVAYIEALDLFAGRFAEFVRAFQPGNSTLLQPQTMTNEIRRNFVNGEIGPGKVATLTAAGDIVPAFTGGDDEGAVYGCIFVDFARRVNLKTAVSSYLESASAGVMTFGGYKNWISTNRPQDLDDLEAAQATWGL